MKRDIKVASVQFNHHAGDKAYNLSVIEEYVRQASESGVEIISFPEMCITGYWHVSALSRDEIQALAEPVPNGESTQQLIALATQFESVLAQA